MSITLRLGKYAIQIHYTISRLTGQGQLSPWEERDRTGMLNRQIDEASHRKDVWWW